MRRKFLSVVLCMCMMLTMAPFAFAEGVSSGGGGGSSAATLQSKIDALGSEGGIVTLDNDYTGTITINTGKNITLNLNNHNLSSSTGDAIVNKGTLTIKGSGQVSTTANGSAAIANFPDAVANVNGGTYTSSEWYVIKNLGTMTITGDVTVKKPDGSQNTASLIDNGWYNSSDTVANEPVTAQNDKAKLTIKSGNFKGNSGQKSCSVVKNDDGGILNISGGTFDSTANKGAENATTILNWNVATISGGTFTGSYPLSNGSYDNNNLDIGELTVTGGTFTAYRSLFGQNGGAASGKGFIKISGGEFNADTLGAGFTYTVSISGGTFSAEPTTYIADGYVAKRTNNDKFMVVPTSADNAVAQIGTTYYNTLADAVADASNSSKDTIKLLRNTRLNSTVSISKPVVLDLGGYVLNGAGTLLDLYGDVTLQNGTIETTGAGTGAVWVNQTAKLTVNNDVLMNTTQASSFAIAYWRDCTTAEVTFRGKITGGNGITVNGLITDTTTANKLTVDGATINVGGHGIYQAGYATTTFTENASTITGSTGIEVRAGNLTVTNSTITGNGTFNCKSNPSGTTTDGVGIAIAQHTTKLPIDVTISGGNISGTYAVYESDPENNGTEYTKDVKLSITGGYFTTDPTSYLAANRYTVASDKDGYSYMVTDQAPSAAPVIVADKTEAQANLPQNTDTNVATSINNVIKNANIDGVAEAVKKDAILAEANVPDADKGNKNVKIVIDVKVNVTATNVETTGENNAITTLTFEASPVASIKKVTSSGESYYSNTDTTPISVSNSYLNGQAITVKLPLPTGFTPKQIKHTSVDGTVEYFLDHLERGAKVFTIDKANNCAILKITKFSTFEVSGTQTYVEPSSGGSISAPTTYAVNVNAATNGAVAADKKTASKGTTVTVTASPSKGYVVDAVKVVDKDGKDVAVTEKDGKYVFTMPASAVTVTGSFKAETPAPVALPFSDVKSGNWFYDAVKYAYEQGLMTGTSATTFAPNGTMNRAMIVTVLYRLEKSPAVTGASKFTDVPAGQWYSDAVAWAAANKIVNGYDETTFGPMNAVTREQMAAILFRYEQVKGLENVTLEENLNRFPDQNKISAYAIPALQWAVGQKIINGNADGTLDPTGTATRAQVAQIFTNLLNK